MPVGQATTPLTWHLTSNVGWQVIGCVWQGSWCDGMQLTSRVWWHTTKCDWQIIATDSWQMIVRVGHAITTDGQVRTVCGGHRIGLV